MPPIIAARATQTVPNVGAGLEGADHPERRTESLRRASRAPSCASSRRNEAPRLPLVRVRQRQHPRILARQPDDRQVERRHAIGTEPAGTDTSGRPSQLP